jgi:hypothetical protein
MNDNALFILIRSIITNGLVAGGITDAEVSRGYQPDQQGADSGKNVYLHKISDHRHGFPFKRDKWETDTMVHTESVIMETTFQVDARFIADPSDINALTASDIVNMVAMILQSDIALATLKAQNVGIYRISSIREPYIINDYDRNESSPSFDFTLTHTRSTISETPILETIEPDIYRV